jgi:hypothetical protein
MSKNLFILFVCHPELDTGYPQPQYDMLKQVQHDKKLKHKIYKYKYNISICRNQGINFG